MITFLVFVSSPKYHSIVIIDRDHTDQSVLLQHVKVTYYCDLQHQCQLFHCIPVPLQQRGVRKNKRESKESCHHHQLPQHLHCDQEGIEQLPVGHALYMNKEYKGKESLI